MCNKELPDHKIYEEGVALTHAEVIQQYLRDITGVLQETGEPSKHLHNLQRREVIWLLHVLDARRQALFLYKNK